MTVLMQFIDQAREISRRKQDALASGDYTAARQWDYLIPTAIEDIREIRAQYRKAAKRRLKLRRKARA